MKNPVVVRAVEKIHVFVASKNTRTVIIPTPQMSMNIMMTLIMMIMTAPGGVFV